MDFHGMKRKELQALCKKYKIPANLTNVEMANRLTALLMGKEKFFNTWRSCLKGSDENGNENESDKDRNAKKVRFSPETETIEFEKSEAKFLEIRTRGRRKSVINEDCVVEKVTEPAYGVGNITMEKRAAGEDTMGNKLAKNADNEEYGMVTRRSLRNREVVDEIKRENEDVGLKEKMKIGRPRNPRKGNVKGSEDITENREIDAKCESNVENENGYGNEPDAENRHIKKVRFSPETETIEFEKSEAKSLEIKTRGRRKSVINKDSVVEKDAEQVYGLRNITIAKRASPDDVIRDKFATDADNEPHEVVRRGSLRNREVVGEKKRENEDVNKGLKKNGRQRISRKANVESSKEIDAECELVQPEMVLRRSARNVEKVQDYKLFTKDARSKNDAVERGKSRIAEATMVKEVPSQTRVLSCSALVELESLGGSDAAGDEISAESISSADSLSLIDQTDFTAKPVGDDLSVDKRSLQTSASLGLAAEDVKQEGSEKILGDDSGKNDTNEKYPSNPQNIMAEMISGNGHDTQVTEFGNAEELTSTMNSAETLEQREQSSIIRTNGCPADNEAEEDKSHNYEELNRKELPNSDEDRPLEEKYECWESSVSDHFRTSGTRILQDEVANGIDKNASEKGGNAGELTSTMNSGETLEQREQSSTMQRNGFPANNAAEADKPHHHEELNCNELPNTDEDRPLEEQYDSPNKCWESCVSDLQDGIANGVDENASEKGGNCDLIEWSNREKFTSAVKDDKYKDKLVNSEESVAATISGASKSQEHEFDSHEELASTMILNKTMEQRVQSPTIEEAHNADEEYVNYDQEEPKSDKLSKSDEHRSFREHYNSTEKCQESSISDHSPRMLQDGNFSSGEVSTEPADLLGTLLLSPSVADKNVEKQCRVTEISPSISGLGSTNPLESNLPSNGSEINETSSPVFDNEHSPSPNSSLRNQEEIADALDMEKYLEPRKESSTMQPNDVEADDLAVAYRKSLHVNDWINLAKFEDKSIDLGRCSPCNMLNSAGSKLGAPDVNDGEGSVDDSYSQGVVLAAKKSAAYITEGDWTLDEGRRREKVDSIQELYAGKTEPTIEHKDLGRQNLCLNGSLNNATDELNDQLRSTTESLKLEGTTSVCKVTREEEIFTVNMGDSNTINWENLTPSMAALGEYDHEHEEGDLEKGLENSKQPLSRHWNGLEAHNVDEMDGDFETEEIYLFEFLKLSEDRTLKGHGDSPVKCWESVSGSHRSSPCILHDGSISGGEDFFSAAASEGKSLVSPHVAAKTTEMEYKVIVIGESISRFADAGPSEANTALEFKDSGVASCISTCEHSRKDGNVLTEPCERERFVFPIKDGIFAEDRANPEDVMAAMACGNCGFAQVPIESDNDGNANLTESDGNAALFESDNDEGRIGSLSFGTTMEQTEQSPCTRRTDCEAGSVAEEDRNYEREEPDNKSAYSGANRTFEKQYDAPDKCWNSGAFDLSRSATEMWQCEVVNGGEDSTKPEVSFGSFVSPSLAAETLQTKHAAVEFSARISGSGSVDPLWSNLTLDGQEDFIDTMDLEDSEHRKHSLSTQENSVKAEYVIPTDKTMFFLDFDCDDTAAGNGMHNEGRRKERTDFLQPSVRSSDDGRNIPSAEQFNSAGEMKNMRTILIHGTPNKLRMAGDMKENFPCSKMENHGSFTTVRPTAKRSALKDVLQK